MTTSVPRRSALPVLLTLATCLIATISYIGAVTGNALAVLMLPATLIIGVVGARNRDKTMTGVIVSVVAGGAAAEVVNVLSGAYEGPAARGTFVAAICAGLALVLSGTKYPALFLLPVGGIITGALALGAGGRVQLVALVTSAVALVALSAVERERRAMVTPARMGAPVALALLLVLVAGVFAALFQHHFDSLPVRSPFESTFRKTIHPSSVFSLGKPTKTPPVVTNEPGQQVANQPGGTPTTKPTTSRTTTKPTMIKPTTSKPSTTKPATSSGGKPTTQPVGPTKPNKSGSTTSASGARQPSASQVSHHHHLSWLWLLLLIPLLLVLALMGRLLWSWWAWRRLYRRIMRRSAPPQAAWLWTVAHLGRVGVAMPLQSSPDVVAAGGVNGLRPELHEPVRELARIVAPAVFAADPDAIEPDQVWGLARVAADEAWTSSTRLRRAHARWRLPER